MHNVLRGGVQRGYVGWGFGLDGRCQFLRELSVLDDDVFDLGVVGGAPLLHLIAEQFVAVGGERLPAPHGQLGAVRLCWLATACGRRRAGWRRCLRWRTRCREGKARAETDVAKKLTPFHYAPPSVSFTSSKFIGGPLPVGGPLRGGPLPWGTT